MALLRHCLIAVRALDGSRDDLDVLAALRATGSPGRGATPPWAGLPVPTCDRDLRTGRAPLPARAVRMESMENVN